MYILIHFFAVLVPTTREMIKFEVMWRTGAPDEEFSTFSLNVQTVLTNFVLGMWTHTFQAERHGVIAKLLLSSY